MKQSYHGASVMGSKPDVFIDSAVNIFSKKD